jgi:hypothetical protein
MALASRPWLVVSGLPRIAHARDESEAATDRGSKWVPLALALPGVLLGLRLDVESGFAQRDRLLVVAISLVLAWILALGARHAAGSRGAHARHAIAWLAFVPGMPLLWIAVKEGGAPLLGEPPAFVGALAGISPLTWLWQRVDAPGDLRVAGPLLACIAVGLCSLSRGPRGEASG